jgi:23S rRNA (guanine745-N1)-methyltransferase
VVRQPLSHHRFALFRCPVCRGDLALAERRLACAKGHSFDLAKSGYVNLTPASRHAPAGGGDTRLQLEHRTRFLARGHFDAIADEIAGQASGTAAILEAGCGTGFHLARLVERMAPWIAAGIDLSKDAAAWCARRYPDLGCAVADVWGPWPLHDGCVDLVASIFAPKNFPEMARVLRRGGWLALALPGAGHLQELRAVGLIGAAADKAERYRDRLTRDFTAPVERRILRHVALERDAMIDAILMGPSARHLAGIAFDRVPEMIAVTIDVVLLFARRR